MMPLVAQSMVLYEGARGRFRLHDLMQDVARGRSSVSKGVGLAEDLDEQLEGARGRHATHFLGVLTRADELFLKGDQGVVEGLALFDLERHSIEAGQLWTASAAHDDPKAATLCVGYPNAGIYVLNLRLLPHQQITWLEAAVKAAREIGDRRGEGNALGNLGLAYKNLGEPRRAIELHEQALRIFEEIEDPNAEKVRSAITAIRTNAEDVTE